MKSIKKKYIVAIILIVIGLILCLFTSQYVNFDDVKFDTFGIEEKI